MTSGPGLDLTLDVLVVGAGPCGLAAAISAQRAGLSVLVFDAACVVSSVTQYPTYATFFSTAEKLALGGLPFVIADAKPTRRDALAYYREVVRHFALHVRQYERVESIERSGDAFLVRTLRRGGQRFQTRTRAIIVATGYWGSPNLLNVLGEDLPHVSHSYHEGHAAFQQHAVVVGGGNSAAEAALDLWRAGAKVTLVHFGPAFDKKIKPWVLPDFNNRAAEGSIDVRWNSRVAAIDGEFVTIRRSDHTVEKLRAEHVFLMTGFAPNVQLLQGIGVTIDPATGIPTHDPSTLETNIPGVFMAGVVVAGYDANKVFIENGRYHGDRIVARLTGKPVPPPPTLSRELDS
ncbi:MAG: YpdA family putative bacillithiol disulfide reductase [Gemmatimonadaceae bacterium]